MAVKIDKSSSTTSILRFTPSEYNRMPPPGWRWERARWLLENHRRPTKIDDPWVLMAYRFRKDLLKAKTLAGQERLSVKYPGIYMAWWWYTQEDAVAKTRWTIEAYLCADATFKQIADRIGEHPKAVGCYAKVFFDVVGKTKHWMWVLNEVIGQSVHHGIDGRHPDLLWKLFGLLAGPLFLDVIVRQDGVPLRITSYAQYSTAHENLFRSSIQTKALYAARSIPTYESEIIFAAYQKMREIESQTDNTQKAHSSILDGIHNLTQSVGFVFGHRSVESLAVKHYDTNGVEFRASELVAAAFDAKPKRKLIGPMPEPTQPSKDAQDAEANQR